MFPPVWPWLIFFTATTLISFLLLPANVQFNFDLKSWFSRQQRRSPIWIHRYQIPGFNRKLLDRRGQLRSCSQTGEMDIEVAFSAVLHKSAYLTDDWQAADYFYLPIYPACHYQQCLAKRKSPQACKQSVKQYLEQALHWLEEQPGKEVPYLSSVAA